jgi:VWFA-related protein
MSVRFFILVFAIILFFAFGVSFNKQNAGAQSGRVPQPSPTPPDDTVKVYTEEVRLPVVALDEYERFDPTLVVDDVLVLEDGVPQQVKSVQRIPANVLFLLGTGGETNPAMRTSMTQLTALKVLSKLHQGDNFAVIQFNSKVEKLQDWTTDYKATANVIKWKLKSANGTRMTKAFEAAFEMFANQPFGNRHIVLITDGIEMPGGRLKYDDKMKVLALFQMQENQKAWDNAVRKLNETQATIHIISYTAFAREVYSSNKKSKPTFGTRRSTANDSIASTIDPTVPPGTQRGSVFTPTIGMSVTFDPQMKKLRKAYENATKTSEKRLTSLAEETGTKILLPTSDEEMLEQVSAIARDIGAQYVVTYSPKKPITSANIGEYRRINVNPRRIGLTLRTRRGYVVVPPKEQ